MIDPEVYREIYAILDSAGPVPYDCGTLCNGICCSDQSFDDGDSYIYLFPGEKEYLELAGSRIRIERQRRDEHDLPKSWGEYVYIARCPGKETCDRATRPIQCRTFPLQPYITERGELEMRLCYIDIPYSCPFVEGKADVSDDFRWAAYKAWSILVKDRAIRELVKSDSKEKRDNEDNGH